MQCDSLSGKVIVVVYRSFTGHWELRLPSNSAYLLALRRRSHEQVNSAHCFCLLLWFVELQKLATTSKSQLCTEPRKYIEIQYICCS